MRSPNEIGNSDEESPNSVGNIPEPDAWRVGNVFHTKESSAKMDMARNDQGLEPLFTAETIQEEEKGECPDCGLQFNNVRTHRMKCAADQVLEEQMKSLQGIVDELKNGQEREEVIEMLEYHITTAPEVMGEVLHDLQQAEIQNLGEVFDPENE